jgi:sterol desaturase/sphingolipid hydroxylase (fatty acid hydroxylase superfamily)
MTGSIGFLSTELPLSVHTWMVQQIVFHVVGGLFEWSDRSGALHRAKRRDVDRKPYFRLLPRVLLNQFLVLLPSMILVEKAGLCFSGPTHMPPVRFIASLGAMAIGHDVVQYVVHRHLLHRPNLRLMRMLRHSVHHSTGATKAISACFMSGPDFFLEIVLPYLVPLAAIGGAGADIAFHTVVAASGAIGGLYEHSGYDFSELLLDQTTTGGKTECDGGLREWRSLGEVWAAVKSLLAGVLDNRAHGEHHSRGNVSFSDGFGSPGFCDTLFGTRWDLVPKRSQQLEYEWQMHMQNVTL